MKPYRCSDQRNAWCLHVNLSVNQLNMGGNVSNGNEC